MRGRQLNGEGLPWLGTSRLPVRSDEAELAIGQIVYCGAPFFRIVELTWPIRVLNLVLLQHREPHPLMIMPVCKYFPRTSGCLRGDRCYYQHIQPPSQEDLDSTRPPPNIMPSRKIINENLTGPAEMPLSGFSGPLAEVNSRFFYLGVCKNGDDYRFLHNATGEEEVAPKAIPPQARNGHLVPTFG